MPPSEKLIKWANKHCPSLDINSLEFTVFLLKEVNKLIDKIKEN